MNCDETRQCLDAHADGELDPGRDAEVLRHLEGCATCADTARHTATWRKLIRERLRPFAAPPGLEAHIRAAGRASPPPARRTHSPWSVWLFRRPQAAALAASLAFAAVLGYQIGVQQGRNRVLRDEYVSNHLRALLTGHVMDVTSSDQHTVKPWFAGRIDFSPTVRDLAADGFPLLGGRLERIDGRMAAVLIYQRRQHSIDLYLARDTAAPVPREGTQAGYNLVTWIRDGFRCVAVSDLSPAELQTFARLQQEPPRERPVSIPR